jgi:hypothetical protein
MQFRASNLAKGVSFAFAAVLAAVALVAAGCSAANSLLNSVTSNPQVATTAVPMSITDAPSDQILGASLTLNSIVLNTANGSTSLISSPLTFEATHLDAVQEPLFTPAIPQATYTGVTLTYSNAQVAYIDPTTKKLVLATATLANTTQTITFPTPLAVNNASTTLLIDYLVANSVTVSGTTVTVAPAFHVVAAPIAPQPTNGTNGLQCGIKGQIAALGTDSFTLTNAGGTSFTIAVNANTQYQGVTGFSALTVGDLVEVDVLTQANGSLLAARIEQEAAHKNAAILLVGHVASVTGSPVTSFTELVHQNVGSAASANPLVTDTIAVTGSTVFALPGRFVNLSGNAAPFSTTFSAATLFAGQSVSVATTAVSNNAATAVKVTLHPQTVNGTVTGIASSGSTTVYTLTLPAGHWLATVTGQSTVTVYTNNNVQPINATPLAVGNLARFNGFLFSNKGALVMRADAVADPPGTPIAPHN